MIQTKDTQEIQITQIKQLKKLLTGDVRNEKCAVLELELLMIPNERIKTICCSYDKEEGLAFLRSLAHNF